MPVASARRTSLSPTLAAVIIFIAIAAWGLVAYLQLKRSPAARHIEAGNEYARHGDGSRAVAEWRAATQIEPKNALAWQLLGQSFYEAKMWNEAKSALSHVATIAPDTPRLDALLASCSSNLNQPEEALKYGREALKRTPDDVPTLQVCIAALTQIHSSDPNEMIGYLRRLTQLEPNNVEHYIALAQALIGQNNAADVLPILDHILQLAPNRAEMYALRGFSRFFADGSEAGMRLAESDLLHALILRPKLYVSDLYLGKIYRRRGEWQKAQRYLTAAVRLSPQKPDAYFDLAAVYKQLRQPVQAAAALKRFTQITRRKELFTQLKTDLLLAPNNFDLNLKAGRMAIEQNELPEARHYLTAAYQLRPNDHAAQAGMRELQAMIDRMSNLPDSAKDMNAQAVEFHTTGGQ
jgi:tetratricopeptide (TPR) repeat protein